MHNTAPTGPRSVLNHDSKPTDSPIHFTNGRFRWSIRSVAHTSRPWSSFTAAWHLRPARPPWHRGEKIAQLTRRPAVTANKACRYQIMVKFRRKHKVRAYLRGLRSNHHSGTVESSLVGCSNSGKRQLPDTGDSDTGVDLETTLKSTCKWSRNMGISGGSDRLRTATT